MDNSPSVTGIELPPHLTLNPGCRVNEGGCHDETCAHNYNCLRSKDAPLFPPGLSINQMNTPEVALRLDLQKRSLVDTSRGSVDQDTAQHASGYPRPSQYWEKQEISFPRRSQYWETGQKAPNFRGRNFGASQPWDKSQQGLEVPKSSQVGYGLGSLPECSIPPQRLVPVTDTLGSPAPAQSHQGPRRRNLLGRIVEQACGVARYAEAEILAPKPIRPCANPKDTSQMSSFLARYASKTPALEPVWARAWLLHVENECSPCGPEVGDSSDECSEDECDDEECCGAWENWVEKLVMENAS